MDPPPRLDPEDKPEPAELGRLALELLRELARDDPALAERMIELGIDPDPEAPSDAAVGQR
jgi:hypothetical protein